MKNISYIFILCTLLGCTKKKNDPPADNLVTYKANGQYIAVKGINQGFFSNGVTLGKVFNPDSSYDYELYAENIDVFFSSAVVLNTKIKVNHYSSFYFDDNHIYYFDSLSSYILFTRHDSVNAGSFICNGTNDLGQKVAITEGMFYVIH